MLNLNKKNEVAEHPDITQLESKKISEKDFKVGQIISLLNDTENKLRFQGIIAELVGFGFNNRANISLQEISKFVEKYPNYIDLKPKIKPFIRRIKPYGKKDVYKIVMNRLCKVLYGEDYQNKTKPVTGNAPFITPRGKELLDPDDARFISPEKIEKAERGING